MDADGWMDGYMDQRIDRPSFIYYIDAKTDEKLPQERLKKAKATTINTN